MSDYQMQSRTERVADLVLHLECVADLNTAIDTCFERLEYEGRIGELERLCPYFGVLWPAARALAEHLARLPARELRGTRFLELGCGLALPTLVAARLGAHVTASDSHPDVAQFLKRNAELNSVSDRIRFIEASWRDGAALWEGGPYDRIVASDVLYESYHPEELANIIPRLAARDARICIADPARPYLQALVDAMAAKGFDCETEAAGSIFLAHFRNLIRADGPSNL